MKYHDLIQLYFERSAALQTLWTLYVVILGGLLAFSSLRQRRDVLTTSLITVLFCIFAFRNLGGIHDVIEHRQAVFQLIKQYPADPAAGDAGQFSTQRGIIEPSLLPIDYNGARNFHVIGDVLAVAALWSMERRRKVYGEIPPTTIAPVS
jgi:hypothetical protein